MLLRYFSLGIAFTLSCSPLFATDRFYDDLSAKSADSHWAIEAKSPDNRTGDRWSVPFQKNFVYTLRHDEKPAWTRKQGDGWASGYSEPAPIELAVSNAGRVVVTSAWNSLMVMDDAGRLMGEVDPAKGRFGGVSPEDELFSEKEREENVSRTTAGKFWRRGSIGFFHDDASGSVYVLRTYWGRWIVLDLKTGKALTPTADRLAVIERSAKARVRGLLKSYMASGSRKESEGCPDWDFVSAVHQAGCLGMREAILAMRRMEACDAVTSYGNYCELAPRIIARMALRRVGETPTTAPGFVFGSREKVRSTQYGPKTMKERVAAMAGIKVGMTKKELLQRVGAPDHIGFFEESWEYDMADDTTLTLVFDKEHDGSLVVKSKNIVPPTWKTGASRERNLFR